MNETHVLADAGAWVFYFIMQIKIAGNFPADRWTRVL